MASTKETISGVRQPAGTELALGCGIFNSGGRHPADISMAGVNESNSGGRHPAAMTGDANTGVGCGSQSAVPALDAEILTAVRALNGYPKRGKDKTQNLLACRIAKRWLDLQSSTRDKLEALQKCSEEDLQESVL